MIGIDWKRTSSNHIPKVFEILGIEAARSTIINEMENTMGHHGIHVDRRHLMMLADYMTYTGPGLSIELIAFSTIFLLQYLVVQESVWRTFRTRRFTCPLSKKHRTFFTTRPTTDRGTPSLDLVLL